MAVSRFKTSTILNGTPKYRNANVGALPLPATPTVGTATDLGTGTTVSVGFTPVGSYGQQFTAVSSPGSLTGTSVVSPIVVSGLSAGTAYTFQVRSENATGFSALSSASNSVTPAVPPGFESIATVTATGGETSLTFSNIPQGYASLQIRSKVRDTYNADWRGFAYMRLNSDATDSYRYHALQGDGSAVSAYGGGANAYSGVFAMALGDASTANAFGVSVTDIHDYASTTRNKTVRSFTGADTNGSGAVTLLSFLWLNTSAVSTITIYPAANAFKAGTTFALYGVKAAA